MPLANGAFKRGGTRFARLERPKTEKTALSRENAAHLLIQIARQIPVSL
jgi:hypothetical protein